MPLFSTASAHLAMSDVQSRWMTIQVHQDESESVAQSGLQLRFMSMQATTWLSLDIFCADCMCPLAVCVLSAEQPAGDIPLWRVVGGLLWV